MNKKFKKFCSIFLIIAFSVTMIIQPAFANTFSPKDNTSITINSHEWIRQDRDDNTCTLVYTDNDFMYQLHLDKSTLDFTFERFEKISPFSLNESTHESYAIKITSSPTNPNEIYSLCLTDSDNNSYLISENPKERLAFAIPAWLGLSAEAIQALIALGLVVIVDGIAHIFAEEKIQELKRKPELIYFRAVLDEEKKGVFLGENITRQNALIIIQLNSSTTGVFCNGEKYARSLTETLNGPAKHCPGNHGLSQGYWNHYHCKKAPNTHIWYI